MTPGFEALRDGLFRFKPDSVLQMRVDVPALPINFARA